MGQTSEPTTNSVQGSKRSKSKSSVILISLGVVLLVIIGTGVGYVAGLQKGKELAKQEITKKVTDLLNPLNALSTNPLFPNSVVGKVTTANNTEITVKQINGESKKVVLDKETKITKQAKEAASSEIKAGADVTVILKKTSSDYSDTASRVIIR